MSSKFVEMLRENPLRFIHTMQQVSQKDLTEFMINNIEITVRVRRFLQMHNGNENTDFMRGVAVGLIFGLAGHGEAEGEVAEDLRALIGILTSQNVNLFTGGSIREEKENNNAE